MSAPMLPARSKPVRRCPWLRWVCVVVAASWLGSAHRVMGADNAAPPKRPNVLVIYLDDMGWGQPGVYGGTIAPTPHLDDLAARGVRFTHGYVSSPVCSPSRAGLLTGRYQGRFAHDFLNTPDLDLRQATLADRLRALGYATGIVGKWHLGLGPGHLPGARGFDSAFGSVENLGTRQFYRGTAVCEPPSESPVTSPLYAREALEFIARHDGRRPWFLYLAFNAVHVPHAASPEWLARFSAIKEPRARAYAAVIAEADDAIGRVLAALRARGSEADTLVCCVSDNGGIAEQAEMGGLRGHKYQLWEGGVRVPFIVAWPAAIPRGRVIADPVIQLDLWPTIVAAAGGATPADERDGVDLLPRLRGVAGRLEPRPLFWRYGPQFAVRLGDWKLVKATTAMEPMLVNLAEDPGEKEDLSLRFPERKSELLARWRAWNESLPPQRMDLADGRSSGLDPAGRRVPARDNDD